MTLLSDRLKDAGANTAEARLMALACEALREGDGSIAMAANALWAKLKTDSWVAKDVWLMPYLRERQRDMRGAAAAPQAQAVQPPAPRPRPMMTPERKAVIEKAIKKAAEAIKFNYLTTDGRDWASVGVHELDGMARDGSLAQAVKNKLGVLTNSQRFKTIGELMSPALFDEAKREAT